MKPKSTAVLTLAALLGAGLTGFLVVALVGADKSARSGDGGTVLTGRGAAPAPEGGGGGGDGAPAATQTTSDRVASGTWRGVLGTKRREPHDSELTAIQRAAMSREVFELLEAIQGAEPRDSAKRRADYLRLQKLLRDLGHRVSPEAKRQLLEMLHTAPAQWRATVGDTLGYLYGDEEVADALLAMFKERPESVHTRNAILLALGKIQVPKVVPELVRALGEPMQNKSMIVSTLGRLNTPEANAALVAHLSGPMESATRREIERTLGATKNPAVLKQVAKDLADADPTTRRSYVSILGMSRKDEYAPVVRDLLKDERDPKVRQEAIRALGNFGDKESGAMLVDIVQHGGSSERAQATRAIHRIKDPETVRELAGKWEEFNTDGRIAVLGAARSMSKPPEAMQKIALRHLSDANERIRNSSVQLLGRRGNNDAVDPIAGYLLKSTTLREQSTAVHALLAIDTLEAAQEGLRAINVIRNRTQRDQYQRKFEQMREKHQRIRDNSTQARER